MMLFYTPLYIMGTRVAGGGGRPAASRAFVRSVT